jgi:hypothetical protein
MTAVNYDQVLTYLGKNHKDIISKVKKDYSLRSDAEALRSIIEDWELRGGGQFSVVFPLKTRKSKNKLCK